MKHLFRLFRARRSRRGVTVVETVVAMAVITIVSFTALSVIKSSQSTAREDGVYNDTRYRAEAALECFQFSDDLPEFEQTVSALLTKDNGRYEYNTNISSLTVTVTYPEQGRPTFSAVAYGKNNKVLFRLNYTKGGTLGESETQAP